LCSFSILEANCIWKGKGMTNYTDPVVRELQLKELDILKDTITIMDRIGVKYYLSAGTLLGAVRHQGFIPWDDDIDIMMPRNDYEKFVREVDRYLPDYYKLLYYGEHYNDDIKEEMVRQIASSAVAKILDMRYAVKRTVWSKDHIQPIWIDIAVLDEIPENNLSLWIYRKRLMFNHYALRVNRLEYKGDNHVSKQKVADIALAINRVFHFGKLIDPIKIIKRMDDILKSYDNRGYSRYINFYGEYKFKEVVPVDFLGKDTFLDFEGIPMRVPEHYDIYLKACYGDYMKLPPVEDRVCKHKMELIRIEEGKANA